MAALNPTKAFIIGSARKCRRAKLVHKAVKNVHGVSRMRDLILSPCR